jgi:ABC-type branched-subunit amino acid transport system permease subunit
MDAPAAIPSPLAGAAPGAAGAPARPWPLLVAAATLLALPFTLDAVGLPLRSAIDVVVFAIACMGLNVLVGHTGLVSFGHGAWFGLGAYAAALSQRHLFPDGFVLPALFALAFVIAAAAGLGALILRRRGVYFSLLTLALTALLFAIAFRWTAFTGGESGLGGVVRPVVLGIDLGSDPTYYAAVAAVGFAVCLALWRFHRSPVGSVLVAIRENEGRARFIGYPTNRYKLLAFVVSAATVGVAGTLSVFNHRFASAEPLSVAFSGELIAMVVIGGMRSFLGPALGALFFILFREFLSIWTNAWLFWFGLLFVGFIVFSPSGLVGVAGRLLAPFRSRATEAAAMAGRTIGAEPLPAFLRPADRVDGPILSARGIAKSFGGIKAVQGADLDLRDRSLHALIGPNGAGKTTAFNILSGMFPPDAGDVVLAGRSVAGLSPERITEAGVGRSFQITNLFPGLTVAENLRLAVQARHPRRFDPGVRRTAFRRSSGTRRASPASSGYPAWSGQRPARCPTAASACSTWGSRSRRGPACSCSTSRWQGSPRPSAGASATSSNRSRPTSPCCWSSTTSTGCSRSPTGSR